MHHQRSKAQSEAQFDCQQALLVPMGSDRMADIGAAPGGVGGATGWVQAVVAACGAPAPPAPAWAVDWDMYAEPGTQRGGA